MDRPELAVVRRTVELLGSFQHRSPQFLTHEFHPFECIRIGGGFLFRQIEEPVDPVDFGRMVDFCPQLEISWEHRLKSDRGVDDFADNVFHPMPFQRVVELFHFRGGRTVHQAEMFLHKSIHIGGDIPHHFAEHIVVHEVGDPVFGFRFQETAENLRSGFFEKTADRPRREGGNIQHRPAAAFADIGPQIGFAVQFLFPVLHQLQGSGLTLRIAFIPRPGLRQLDDHVVRNVRIGDFGVGGISHHGDVSRHPFLFQFPRDVRFELPDQVAAFLGIPGGEDGPAFRTMAGIHTVTRHDVEEREAVTGSLPVGLSVGHDDATRGCALSAQERFGVQIDHVFQIFIAVAQLPPDFVDVFRIDAVDPFPVVAQGKIFRMGLGETLDQPQIGQPVAVRQIQRAHPGLEEMPHSDFPDRSPTVERDLFSQCAMPVISLTVGIVRPVDDVDFRQFPVAFPGNDRADLAGKIEPHAAETFQKFINAVQRSPFVPLRDVFLGIRPGVVVARDHDPVANGFDNVAVTVQFIQIEPGQLRAGRSQNECRLFARGVRGHGNLAAERVLEIRDRRLALRRRKKFRNDFCLLPLHFQPRHRAAVKPIVLVERATYEFHATVREVRTFVGEVDLVSHRSFHANQRRKASLRERFRRRTV